MYYGSKLLEGDHQRFSRVIPLFIFGFWIRTAS